VSAVSAFSAIFALTYLIKRLSTVFAAALSMKMEMSLLRCGSCEPLKAGVHATALGLSALMGLYNAAAWLARREMHLAINAVLYTALTAWEQKHVAHHLAELRRLQQTAPAEPAVVRVPVTKLAA
jgi:hypothetical protein